MSTVHKRSLLATVSLAALVAASAANAADLKARPRPAVAAVPTWAGTYIGVHGGAVRHETTTDDLDLFSDFLTEPGLFPSSVTQRKWGGLVGGHIGHNWQSGSVVYGVEADFSGVFGARSNRTFNAAAAGVPEYIVTYSSKLKWLSTVRARLGLDYNNVTLPYVTFGLAVAGINNRWGQGFIVDGSAPAFAFQFVDDRARVGWTVGGGVEHRFSPNWSARVEALYVDLRSKTKTIAFTSEGGTDSGVFRTRWENSAIVARAGVTYHFGAAPVVARY
jgi:outer membrane immunogenic protein